MRLGAATHAPDLLHGTYHFGNTKGRRYGGRGAKGKDFHFGTIAVSKRNSPTPHRKALAPEPGQARKEKGLRTRRRPRKVFVSCARVGARVRRLSRALRRGRRCEAKKELALLFLLRGFCGGLFRFGLGLGFRLGFFSGL